MRSGIRAWLMRLFGLTLLVLSVLAHAQAPLPIKIGDINDYSSLPQFATPYRRGWALARDEINAAGGVLGRPLEVISRDDRGNRTEALKQVADLVMKSQVDALMGTDSSSLALAVSEYAARHKKPFLAVGPLTDTLIWERGNAYTFRLRPSTYMHAAVMVDEALKIAGRRWYVVAPNFEYGQSVVATFKALLKARRPDVVFVGEQWPPLGKIEAHRVIAAIADARPDAIFNALTGADLAGFVTQGKTHGLFPRLPVLSLLSGEPEQRDTLGVTLPAGWVVSGYPGDQLTLAAHAPFAASYMQRYQDTPKYASLLGYSALMALAEAVRKAGSTRDDKLVAALRGLQFVSPLGPVSLRAIDHQSTLGVFVGRIDARGVAGHWRYVEGAALQPADTLVRVRRPEPGAR